MKRPVTLIPCGLTILLIISNGSVGAFNEQTHREHLTVSALTLVQQASQASSQAKYSPEIWEKYRDCIVGGAGDEDFPTPSVGLAEGVNTACRANNHYRHAISGTGLTDSLLGLGDPDVDALEWAISNPRLDPGEEFANGSQWKQFAKLGLTAADVDNGNMSWTKAIERYDYTEESKRLAYYNLGFVLHLLEDMGEPEHVHEDPHGASGYNGFEKYVELQANWDRLKPDLARLQPRRLDSINVYFERLAKISYGACRFQAWNPAGSPTPAVDLDSDLAKMFNITCEGEPMRAGPLVAITGSLCLGNPDGSGVYKGGPALFVPRLWEGTPGTHKATDQGGFWPTSQAVTGGLKNDAPGFFYVELSDDVPPPVGQQLSFLPRAYLPTPLPEVADECRGWSQENLNGKKHLYDCVAETVFPPTICYTAGLVQHYFEVVNHPPYVKSLQVMEHGRAMSDTGSLYSATWFDSKETAPGKTVPRLKSRSLRKTPSPDVKPGMVDFVIKFSEPVITPEVKVRLEPGGVRELGQVGGSLKAGSEDQVEWKGNIDIPRDARSLTFVITAKDRNPHYSAPGQPPGDQLDSKPATPARRVVRGTDYPWDEAYEAGADQNHTIEITPKLREATLLDTKDDGKGWRYEFKLHISEDGTFSGTMRYDALQTGTGWEDRTRSRAKFSGKVRMVARSAGKLVIDKSSWNEERRKLRKNTGKTKVERRSGTVDFKGGSARITCGDKYYALGQLHLKPGGKEAGMNIMDWTVREQ